MEKDEISAIQNQKSKSMKNSRNMKMRRKLHNILNQNTEQEDEIKTGQGAANVGVNNENSNKKETENDNVIYHISSVQIVAKLSKEKRTLIDHMC